MANVTYYIGAGASAGKRYSNGTIIEGLPIVNDIPKRLGDYVGRFSTAKFHEGERDWRMPRYDLHELADWEKARQQLVANLDKLYKASLQNATIDTYAKKLVLQNKKSELEKLERLLTFYFILEQILCKPDTRYDTFLANILQDRRQFPDNIKVLSWNYDSQFEIAYEEYDAEYQLSIGSKLSKDYEPYDILKINGSATFQNGVQLPKYRQMLNEKIRQSSKTNIYGDKKDAIECILPDLVLLYQLYVGEASKLYENHTNLSFAFDYNKPSEILFRRANEIIGATDVLVIIGYTFPFFNREVDRKILDLLGPDTEIYIQDLDPEKIRQSFQAVCPGVKDSKIHSRNEVDQFYLPPQL